MRVSVFFNHRPPKIQDVFSKYTPTINDIIFSFTDFMKLLIHFNRSIFNNQKNLIMKIFRQVLGILLMSSITASYAQSNLSAGPVVGVNFARITGDIANSTWKAGPTIGAFFNYSAMDLLGIKGQITYSRLGTQYTNNADKLHFDYLQLPILATLYLNKRGNTFRPKLMVGPYVGLLLGAKDHNGNNMNDTKRYNSLDAGVQLGGGFNYLVGKSTWLNVDVLYGHGLMDLTTNSASTWSNRQLGINVGLSFALGK
ncbi:MAG: PorT family protein [Cytophagia bacterium]|nr:MAG: PorT family protein [Runella sp.]TAG18317.1 MAG: PorT family protein [Cytophagales bacterium]TAG35588.1 MAG: PorT family protein [Cytophagia bacterium]TAG50925.1 MAG: PorT family protein [Runella slithyformis]TAG74955.1 MAG: PorT family protein [Runella slithyformis]